MKISQVNPAFKIRVSLMARSKENIFLPRQGYVFRVFGPNPLYGAEIGTQMASTRGLVQIEDIRVEMLGMAWAFWKEEKSVPLSKRGEFLTEDEEAEFMAACADADEITWINRENPADNE